MELNSEDTLEKNIKEKKINIEKNNNYENNNNNNDCFENKNIETNKNEDLVNNYDDDKELNNENFLLNRKTKNNNELIINDYNNNNKKKKEEETKKKEEYEFGYSIYLLEEKEEGLMEDFLMETDLSDFYNYHLTEEEWQKILHHSILVHYERHLKEEMEKRKKMQNMFMLNMNINMNMNNNIIPTSLMPQMNSLMMNNMNNMNNNNTGLNYQIQMPQTQGINRIKSLQSINNK